VLDDNARNSATGAVSSLVQILVPAGDGRVLGGGVADTHSREANPPMNNFAQGPDRSSLSEKDIVFGR